jgi:hypothetical protein
MATGDNAIVPLFDPGPKITAAATAAIGAGRFVKPSGNFQGGPLLDLTGPTTPLTGGNLMQVAQCVAGDKAIGVAGWDASGAGEVFGSTTGRGSWCRWSAAPRPRRARRCSRTRTGPRSRSRRASPNGMAISAASGGVVYVKLYTLEEGELDACLTRHFPARGRRRSAGRRSPSIRRSTADADHARHRAARRSAVFRRARVQRRPAASRAASLLYELPPSIQTDLFAERGVQEVAPGEEARS